MTPLKHWETLAYWSSKTLIQTRVRFKGHTHRRYDCDAKSDLNRVFDFRHVSVTSMCHVTV